MLLFVGTSLLGSCAVLCQLCKTNCIKLYDTVLATTHFRVVLGLVLIFAAVAVIDDDVVFDDRANNREH